MECVPLVQGCRFLAQLMYVGLKYRCDLVAHWNRHERIKLHHGLIEATE